MMLHALSPPAYFTDGIRFNFTSVAVEWCRFAGVAGTGSCEGPGRQGCRRMGRCMRTPLPPAARMLCPGTSPCYPLSSHPGAGRGGPWGEAAGRWWGGRGCWGPSICIGPAPRLLHNGQVSMAPVLGNGPSQWASRPGTAGRSPWSSSVCHRSLGVCGPEELTSAPAGLLGQASGAVGCGRGGLSSSGPATGPIAAGGRTA